MNELKELFTLLNRGRFLKELCGIDEKRGFSKWINGCGTNPMAKKIALDENDKAKIKAGLRLLIKVIEKTIEAL